MKLQGAVIEGAMQFAFKDEWMETPKEFGAKWVWVEAPVKRVSYRSESPSCNCLSVFRVVLEALPRKWQRHVINTSPNPQSVYVCKCVGDLIE